ncbi:MAG: (2Fe-2S)-binding protein [Caldilineales bacterium]|nr:(2Fe-2S)-binding protein [Caldilineales bacterium]
MKPDRSEQRQSQRVRITVDGREVVVREGMSVAAVLLAEGRRVFRRTQKHGEPRGPFCGMGVCYECLVTVDELANERACVTPVREGMRVETGGQGTEVGGQRSEVGDRAQQSPSNPEPGTQNVELAVIGGGPAGLEAALAAAEAGVQVALIDSAPTIGGNFFRAFVLPTGKATARQRQAAALRQRLDASSIQHLADTLVWGVFPHEGGGGLLALHGPESPKRLHAHTVVIAPGAYDRPIAFPGWSLPGVMTAGAVQTLVKSQGVLPGHRFVFAGSGPLQSLAAAEVIKAGGKVVALLEANRWSRILQPGHLPAVWGQWERLGEGWSAWRTLRRASVDIRFGWAMTAARGETEVEAVEIARLDEGWHPSPHDRQTLAADTLVLGYGFLPADQLTRLLGCEHEYHPQRGGWVPVRDETMQTSLPGVYAVGDGAGIGGAALARLEGRIAGWAAAHRAGRMNEAELATNLRGLRHAITRERRFAAWFGDLFTPRPGLYSLPDDDTIICRCEEVRLREIRAAQAAGSTTLAEIKGLTRAGMGNCQGRMCGELIAHCLIDLPGIGSGYAKQIESIGSLSVRPPIHPLRLADMADFE